jgi:NADH dehydrogenase
MILIAGATGFVGRALMCQLAAEHREVRCLLRPSRREQQLVPGIPLSTISASMGDLPALRTAMQDVTAVVHLTAAEDLYHGKTLSSHVQDTVNLIAAVKETDVSRFIYLSRLGADRASAYPLFRIKGEAEAAVRESGLDYTILQASLTYGREDVFTNMLVMLAKMLPFVLPIPDVSLVRFQPLWVGDLVACIAAVLDRNDLIGQTISLGGPEHFTFDQVMAQATGAPAYAVGARRNRYARCFVAAQSCTPLVARHPGQGQCNGIGGGFALFWLRARPFRSSPRLSAPQASVAA